MTELNQAIDDLKVAMANHMEAQQDSVVVKDKLRKTRSAVKDAMERVRMCKDQILEDNIRDL